MLTFSRLFQAALLCPNSGCVKHHCDPSIDEQFKQNASWDARTQGEYSKVPAKN